MRLHLRLVITARSALLTRLTLVLIRTPKQRDQDFRITYVTTEVLNNAVKGDAPNVGRLPMRSPLAVFDAVSECVADAMPFRCSSRSTTRTVNSKFGTNLLNRLLGDTKLGMRFRMVAARQGFEMVGVDAVPLSAPMMEIKPARDGSVSLFVRDTVRQHVLRSISSVPHRVNSARPKPARGFESCIGDLVGGESFAVSHLVPFDVTHRDTLLQSDRPHRVGGERGAFPTSAQTKSVMVEGDPIVAAGAVADVATVPFEVRLRLATNPSVAGAGRLGDRGFLTTPALAKPAGVLRDVVRSDAPMMASDVIERLSLDVASCHVSASRKRRVISAAAMAFASGIASLRVDVVRPVRPVAFVQALRSGIVLHSKGFLSRVGMALCGGRDASTSWPHYTYVSVIAAWRGLLSAAGCAVGVAPAAHHANMNQYAGGVA